MMKLKSHSIYTVVISLVFLCISNSILPARELKLGFYSGGSKEAQEIFKYRDKADRIIESNSELLFTMGILSKDSKKHAKFRFSQIKPFLLSEKETNLLIVELKKDCMADGVDTNDIIKKILTMTKDLDYKRIVILGASSNGVYYFADKKRQKRKAKSS